MNSGRRCYSGWTNEGHQHFQQVCKDVRKNRDGEGLYVSFEKVFHGWKRTVMRVDEDTKNDTAEKFADFDVKVS
jgi:hypothetical protein